MNDQLTIQQEEFLKKLNRQRGILKDAMTPDVLKILKEHFQTGLPCFQGEQGSYDPLDAMRRDAHREVILWVEHEIEQYKQ